MPKLLRMLGLALSIGGLASAHAELNLRIHLGGTARPAAELADPAKQVEAAGERIQRADAELVGDIREHASLVYWLPDYSVVRLSQGQARRAGAAYVGTVLVEHETGPGPDGKPRQSSLLRTWPAAFERPGFLIFGWVVDGKVTAAQAVAIRPDATQGYRRYSHRFELPESAERGQGVVLLWQEGGFVAPRAEPEDKRLREAIVAVALDDASRLKALLTEGLNPNASVSASKTSLVHLAAEAGSDDVIEVLVTARARLGDQDADQLAPLHLAAARGRAGSVKRLLAGKASRNAKGRDDVTPLILASLNGHTDVVRLLCEANANLDVISRRITAFNAALNAGYDDIVRELLREGYQVDFKNELFERVLITHAGRGNSNMVKLLLDRKVKPSRVDQETTALQAAVEAGDLESIGLLVAAGAPLDKATSIRPSALALAASRGRMESVQALLAAGASPDAREKNGNSAAHFAASFGEAAIMEALLEKGADINAANAAGLTPLGMAVIADNREVVTLLRSRGAKLDWRGAQGALVVEGVLRMDAGDLLAAMLDDGIPLDFAIDEGWTLGDVASVYRAVNCQRVLTARGVTLPAASARLSKPSELTQRPRLTTVLPPNDIRDGAEEFPDTTVQVELVIGPTGEALFPRVVQSADPRLNRNTREALKHWRFTPPMRGEEAVAVQVVLPVVFPSSEDRARDVVHVDEMPRALVQPGPQYPFELRRDGVQGQVLIEFVVTKEGTTTGVRAVPGSHPGFADAAMAAVQQWTFEPGRSNGLPVNTRMYVPIVFSLNDRPQ